MPAYVLSHMMLTDPVVFRQYTDHTPPTVAAYGGRFLARGNDIETLEGDPLGGRLVILEFPDLEKARAWFEDARYQELSQHRRTACTFTNLHLMDGETNTATPDPRV